MVAITVLAGVFMSACAEKKPPVYPFYQLQEAYDNGFLTEEDIGQIADRNNWLTEGMDSEVEAQIKKAAADFHNAREQFYYGDDADSYSEDNFRIILYCGTYGDYVAFMIEGGWGYTQASWSESVAGYEFEYNNGNQIVVYKIKK